MTIVETDIDRIAFFQIYDSVRRSRQRQRIGCQKMFVLADPDHQRRPLSCTDHALRLVTTNHRDRKRTTQPRHSRLYCLEQVALVKAVDQVSDHFGIRLTRKHITFRFQFGTQNRMVFDDTVMHQRDPFP